MTKIDSTIPDLTGYLLEEISVEDRDRLDISLLTDEGLVDDLLAAEEALVDAYIHHEMPTERRRQFEEGYLGSAYRRTRVDLARSLKERYESPPARPVALPRISLPARALISWASTWELPRRKAREWIFRPAGLAFAGTLMLVLVIGATLLLSTTESRRVVSLDLLAGVRDAMVRPEVFLPPESKKVRLQLEVESANSYRDFSFRLNSSQGEVFLTPDQVLIEVTDRDILTLELAAEQLPPSQIELILDGDHRQRGRATIASYFFKVRR